MALSLRVTEPVFKNIMAESDPLPGPEGRFASYAEFWPFYLREHSKPLTRRFHYVGTALVLALFVTAIVSGNFWWAAAMPVAGYFFAWLSHFAIEKNRPATFTYPLWSLISDFRMFFLWLCGRLPRELEKAGVTSQ